MSSAAERRARANSRLRTAHGILDELDLMRRWKPYGDPVVVGSVALDLVVRPDIDMEIISDQPPVVSGGFGVVAALAELPRVRRAIYLDERDLRGQGLYWRIDYEATPEETWTIDMWLFGPDRTAHSASMTPLIRDALTDDGRDTILAVKEEAVAAGERAFGTWLYRAVLEGGVRSYAEFLDWLGDQDVYERLDWHPSPREPA